jgi:alkyl hydroperoxide reductase 1
MHVPGYIEKLSELRGKGVDIVAVIAFNDAFVVRVF